jgi:hypothetical protein
MTIPPPISVKLPSPALLERCRKGIIFSGPMVPPILGSRKTVTRRMDLSWLKLEVGDLLYLRESLRREPAPVPGLIARFAADRVAVQRLEHWRWQRDHLPAIHMPRELSRAVLRVTERVRREQLQWITEEEALREGVVLVPFYPDDGFPLSKGFMVGQDDGQSPLLPSAVQAFRELWESLHNDPGQRWNDDPALARIPFELVEE